MTANNDLFLRACRREPVERVPVWLMRQAGRYLREYRALKERYDFLTLCRTPELAAQVTVQPINRLGFDAAILFSDILIPVGAMGCRVDFNPGPVFEKAVRTAEDVAGLHVPDPVEETGYVMDAIRLVRRELDGRVPLIGFAGAPVTLATYMVEGGSSKDFHRLRRFMNESPDTARELLDVLTETVTRYLVAQVKAGAQAVQLFDTWAGLLGPDDYRRYAVRGLKRIVAALKPLGAPVIYYANGAGALLGEMRSLGADVIGIDWRTSLAEARKVLGPDIAVQGNLDPCALFAPPSEIESRVQRVLEDAGPSSGHIFNLGHGVLPETPVEHVAALVEAVHRHGSRGETS